MDGRNRTLCIALAATGLTATTAYGDPPAGSPYYTDPQKSVVINIPSPAIEDAQQVFCLLSAINASPLTGAGDYIAQMNGGKCKYGSDTAAVLSAVVNSTLDAQSQLTQVKAWMDFEERINAEDVPVAATFDFSIAQFPGADAPNGDFQVNLCHRYQSGVPCRDQVYFQSGAAPSFFHRYQSGQWQERHALQMQGFGPDSGSGRYQRVESWMGNATGGEDYYFAYDEQHVLRGTECLTRDISDPQTGFLIGSYAVYDASGARLNLQYPQTLEVTFDVPNDPVRFGQYAGSAILLTYANGAFWNLPTGWCGPDPANPGSTRCEHAFVIPFDPIEGRVTSGGQTYWVKWLNRTTRLASKDMSECSALTVPAYVNLPDSSSLEDPSDPNSPNYIGIEPVVTDPPRVIDGLIQY